MNKKITVDCECTSDEKLEIINTKILNAQNTLKKYHKIFGSFEDDFNFEKYKSVYKESNHLIEIIEKYLIYNMPNSILLTGESGTGKTTILKMIWQILVLNNQSVFYFNSAKFENLNYQAFTLVDANKGIRNMIEYAKQVDYILMDDHLCKPHKNALDGYYEIFDNARAYKQKIIMASNINYNEIIDIYKSKDSLMASRLDVRLKGLNLIECEVMKSEVNL